MSNSNSQNDFFDDFEVIDTYTRAEAIADGVLVDVTEWASADKGFSGGFTVPVAVTASVWAQIEAIPEVHKYQDVLVDLQAIHQTAPPFTLRTSSSRRPCSRAGGKMRFAR